MRSRRARSASVSSLVVDQAGVAERAQVLAREKRKTAEGADAADRSRVIRRADRLRRVFDDGNARATGGIEDRIEIRALAEQVHRHDRFGPRRDRGDRLRHDRC